MNAKEDRDDVAFELLKPAWRAAMDCLPAVRRRAAEVLPLLEEAFQDARPLAPLAVRIREDGALSLMWSTSSSRLVFTIDSSIEDSGWHFVSLPSAGGLMREGPIDSTAKDVAHRFNLVPVVPGAPTIPVHEQALERLRNATPEYLNDLTVRAGVHTPDGRLTPEYGGDPAKKVGTSWLPRVLYHVGLTESISGSNRMIASGGVWVDGKIVTDIQAKLPPGPHGIIVRGRPSEVVIISESRDEPRQPKAQRGYTACGAMAPAEERATHEAIARGNELRASVTEEEWEAICETPVEGRQSDTWADEMGIAVANVRAKL